MKRLALALLLCGCATSNQTALAIERGLDAGSAGLDIAVDVVIEKCRAQNLPTEEARAQCVAKIEHVNDVSTPIIELAVASLQTYWIAAAANDKTAAERALLGARHAIEQLPDEYFAGLKLLVQRIR